MMAGLLFARAGVPVVVLEKHADFLRDFRGDTLHPSTLELMHELGLLDRLLQRRHDTVAELKGDIAGSTVTVADFSHLPTVCKFIALMPQWDFLDFLAGEAGRWRTFTLLMQHDVHDLVVVENEVRGIRARSPAGEIEIRADLVIGADGRHSAMRALAALPVRDLGTPIDVLWLRLSRKPGDPDFPLGRISQGHILITLNRGDYWQCAYVIAKGARRELEARGLEHFRSELASAVPPFADRVGELTSWDDIKLLTVSVDRLTQWARPGLLCIGDCAHAMSPIGGVGINLAIQDAVAATNLLAASLAAGRPSLADLQKVRARRWLPTAATQRLQVFLHNRFLGPTLAGRQPAAAAWVIWLLARFPFLRRIPARVVGLGLRPEHVRTPAQS
jgi:2-polyprenyl-6-methoxyphenol hydroxylase-like FAD-dependent oxidoreductase